jgi:hypothetical protein
MINTPFYSPWQGENLSYSIVIQFNNTVFSPPGGDVGEADRGVLLSDTKELLEDPFLSGEFSVILSI